MQGRRLLCMISVFPKTTTRTQASYRPAKSSKSVIKAAQCPLKSKKAVQAKVKMTDFDFVGIAG